MRVGVTFVLLLMLVVTGAWAERRVALVIGNADYTGQGRLPGAVRDARAMDAKLKTLGFKTTLALNVNENALRRVLANFEAVLNRGDVGLVYFSGHGARGESGENYLIPLGAQSLSHRLPTVQGVLSMMERASNRVNIIILDACRNVPGFARRQGLAAQRFGKSFQPVPADVRPDRDVIIVDGENERFAVRQGKAVLFAAAPGELSWEGPRCPEYGGHGCFTGELLQALDKPGLELYPLFQRVRAGVLRSTRNEQAPWFNVAMTGDFYFNNPGSISEDRIWRIGKMIPPDITDPEMIQRLLEIRAFQARRLAKTMNISFGEAARILYGEEAGRLR